MEFLAYVKSHKLLVGGGIVGLIVLYIIYQNAQASSAAASSDLSSPGSSGVTSYDAAASLQNAQVNGQVEVAQVQAGVQSQGIAAQQETTDTLTAAQLAATEQQTASATAIALGGQSAAVEIQKIQSDQQVKQTAIVGNTIDTLGAQHQQTIQMQSQIVAQQVQQIQDSSKHASQDYTAIAPILAIETGQPTAAAATAAANSNSRVAASQTATAAVTGASSIFDDIVNGAFA